MVHAHAVDDALNVKAKQRAVHCLEDFGVFNAHGRKFVDIEEPAPIDLIVGASPPSESVVLLFQKAMKSRAASRRIRRKLVK